jgi:4-aminobutyrate aminotransferase
VTRRPADIAPSESDTNLTSRRAAWQARALDEATRGLLARDSAVFLHQSLSTPCLSTIRKAEGLFIEDGAGRRYMDFHGNNVHHVGYGHPRTWSAAIKAQLDALSFAPRRFASERAVELLAEALSARFQALTGDLAECSSPPGAAMPIEVAIKLARAATGRFKTLSFWDAFHGAGFGASSCRRRERCSAPAAPGRCCRAANMSRPLAATAAPTVTWWTPTAGRSSNSAGWPAPRWWATCSSARATSPR